MLLRGWGLRRILWRSVHGPLALLWRGTEHATAITKGELALKLNQDDVEDASFMKVKAIITEAKSYDVLVGSTVLYPMGFILDFWEETESYRPGWQAGDERKVSLPARFWLCGCGVALVYGNF
jgi:hypothetical protein